MKERKRRTRRQRRVDRRVRLIEAAERLFLRKGFDDASVEEISERAGCSPGAFYSHFDNKEQALRAVIDMRRPAAMQALDHLFPRIPKHEDPIAAVRRAVFRSVVAMGLPCDEIRPAPATVGFRPFGEPESGRDRPSGLTG
jgi:AcrR family transcriptional regulator